MANLSFKRGELNDISTATQTDGVIYFAKDTDPTHSMHGYLFYDEDIRIPVNGAGYYMIPDTLDSSKKNMFIENKLYNLQAGAVIGVGYNDKELWLHRSSSSTSANRGLWSPLFSTSDTTGAWVLKLGAGVEEEQGEYTYIGSPPYINNDGTVSNNRTIRPMTRTGYSLGDSTFPWATAHITEMTGNASTATKLKNARTIQVGNQSESFDGSENIVIPINISTEWTHGTTAGPKLDITINGKSHTIKAIPAASSQQAGIITTESQGFSGSKTFNGYTHHNRGIQVNIDNINNEGFLIYDETGNVSNIKRFMSNFKLTTINHKGTGTTDKIKPAAIWTVHYHEKLSDGTTDNPAINNFKNGVSVCLSPYTIDQAAFYPTENHLDSTITSVFLGTASHKWKGLYVGTISSDGDITNTGNLTSRYFQSYRIQGSESSYGCVVPVFDSESTVHLGRSSVRWNNIYAVNGNFTGTVYAPTAAGETQGTSSDSRLKIVQSNNILEKDLLIYNQLQPVVYKYKDVLSTENHSRTHIGFLAQDVELLINQNGLTSEDCALVQIENLEEDSEYLSVCSDGKKYYLNYNELHGLHTLKNQQQDARLTELETKNKELENTISTLKTQVELLKLAIGG